MVIFYWLRLSTAQEGLYSVISSGKPVICDEQAPRSRVRERLIITALLKELLVFCGTHAFFTVFTAAFNTF
jgi:hypothetical protein